MFVKLITLRHSGLMFKNLLGSKNFLSWFSGRAYVVILGVGDREFSISRLISFIHNLFPHIEVFLIDSRNEIKLDDCITFLKQPVHLSIGYVSCQYLSQTTCLLNKRICSF